MRLKRFTLTAVGALLLAPALVFAAPQTTAAAKQTSTKTAAKTAKPATHSTSGVIRSSDASSLVIAKTDKATKTETFVLNTATVKKGDLAPGAKVAVRYTTEGGQNIATAVTVSAVKKTSAAHKTKG